MEQTNFDEIRRMALKLAGLPTIPELSKDFLISMVASEESLVQTLQGFAALSVTCPVFAKVVDKTMEGAMLTAIKLMIVNKKT